MTKKAKANGSLFGNFLYEQILFLRPHFRYGAVVSSLESMCPG